MGIAAALNVDADVFTRFGGESEQCIVRLRDQVVVKQDLVFHLFTPIQEWWINVIFACASIVWRFLKSACTLIRTEHKV